MCWVPVCVHLQYLPAGRGASSVFLLPPPSPEACCLTVPGPIKCWLTKMFLVGYFDDSRLQCFSSLITMYKLFSLWIRITPWPQRAVRRSCLPDRLSLCLFVGKQTALSCWWGDVALAPPFGLTEAWAGGEKQPKWMSKPWLASVIPWGNSSKCRPKIFQLFILVAVHVNVRLLSLAIGLDESASFSEYVTWWSAVPFPVATSLCPNLTH